MSQRYSRRGSVDSLSTIGTESSISRAPSPPPHAPGTPVVVRTRTTTVTTTTSPRWSRTTRTSTRTTTSYHAPPPASPSPPRFHGSIPSTPSLVPSLPSTPRQPRSHGSRYSLPSVDARSYTTPTLSSRSVSRPPSPDPPLSPVSRGSTFSQPRPPPALRPDPNFIPSIPHPSTFRRPVGAVEGNYVVNRGQEVGLFYSWGDADARTSKVSGGSMRKHPTFEEALADYTRQYEQGLVRASPFQHGPFWPQVPVSPPVDANEEVVVSPEDDISDLILSLSIDEAAGNFHRRN
ncbi:hypothetical protein CONPUDRAFT_152326 [Coniophora puteana RWD-64-598 SS2]|uniref:Ribonuclease H1 N-terminal domain-containing protein n=1 Tax=Coniophora puteana (strain RWD-64-598) TaxID=741705 RepID=A0A5M3MXD9_CONPW|nr:uncharacterized protein CONPUDRAFT_152326 [Coniophora puteana RWD-64-598 SS2]EIW83301.1 hypothetical protein CONPUDRAFT_152326 [Coniophora puteana RWD-64-598 SS2]